MMAQRPSRPGKRPSAFDVSFGASDDADDSSDATSSSSRKRDRGDEAGGADIIANVKRRNLDGFPRPIRKYEPRPYEISETADLLVFGEEQDPPDDDDTKRIRVLSHFTFFDTHEDYKMISLDVLDEDAGGAHHVHGAGFVVAKYDTDEDEGQEDGLDEDAHRQYIRLSRIRRYFTRYWEANSSFYVETDHAIYELDISNTSKKYRSQFRPFWRLQSILRFVISSATDEPRQEFSAFTRRYHRIEVFDQPMTERELWDAVPKLRGKLENVPNADDLRASNVISYLLSRLPPAILPAPKRREEPERLPLMRDLRVEYKGNLDLQVLKMNIPAHVTPRIAELARSLFNEVLVVVGPPPRHQPEPEVPEADPRVREYLIRTQTRRRVQFRPDQRITPRSRWMKHVLIEDEKYEVGDTVLFYPGEDLLLDIDALPFTDTLADHFWFGRIIHMHQDHETVHVQWFEHSSKTCLQELGPPQELFLTDQCGTQKLEHIVGKVTTHYIKADQSLAAVKPQDFFYRYMWDMYEGTFTNVNVDALAASSREPPPDNCPSCDVAAEFDKGLQAEKIHLGMRWHGVDFHWDDSVFIKADEGPCHIGQIQRFIRGREGRGVKVVVRLFGRTDKIGCRPDTTLKDERHLFYTNDEMTVAIEDLIAVCYVLVAGTMPELDAWLAMSPDRFHVKYRFPSLNVVSWRDRHRMRWDDLYICRMCMQNDFKKFQGTKAFLEQEAPLRVFDPFGGTGAFGLGMEQIGCFKLTHAVEISPSAARTLRNNASSADIKVYNQCCNKVLRYAISTHENRNPESLKSIEGRPLPPPPKPGDIDCIIAGFPCQPHSTLNMFRKASDTKSSLILTALSFVDFLKPSYCIFENVRGFLQYNLRARQDGRHSVKGGIPMGGLKLVMAALLDMGYQVRCGLLQAAHYGTPQTRVRFFLIAAKRGLELPPLPQPTHDFPVTDSLEIKFPKEITLQPITTLSGVAPHRYVSVHDAIGDLPKFDWKHPKRALSRRQMEVNHIKECNNNQLWCGFSGPNVPYEHEPHTIFQEWCRSQPTQDIQHYTRTCDPKKVERVVEIPIETNADYRSLRPELWQWQFANPASAAARTGFRGGYYGRVQGDGWFQTTVTQVDPTAKQSRVIHPSSKRIVTVRELARSQGFPDHFVFYAEGDRVVTMLRQIGNAVPWPVSTAIAREFRETLYKDWVKRNPPPEVFADAEFSDDEGEPGDDGAMQVDQGLRH